MAVGVGLGEGSAVGGRREVFWQTGGLAPGVYLVVLRSGKEAHRRMMVRLGER